MMECYAPSSTWESYKRRPLENSWTLWFCLGNINPKDGKTIWEECLQEVSTITTLSDFNYLFYSVVPPVGMVRPGSDISLFKKGIRPMWEDKANQGGGRWVVRLDGPGDVTDQAWLAAASSLVNECFFGYMELICGLTLSVRRKGCRLCLWTRDPQGDLSSLINIGLQFKELLGLPPSKVITYQEHRECQLKSSPGEAKNTYYV